MCVFVSRVGVFFAPMLAVFAFILFWAMFYLKRVSASVWPACITLIQSGYEMVKFMRITP